MNKEDVENIPLKDLSDEDFYNFYCELRLAFFPHVLGRIPKAYLFLKQRPELARLGPEHYEE